MIGCLSQYRRDFAWAKVNAAITEEHQIGQRFEAGRPDGLILISQLLVGQKATSEAKDGARAANFPFVLGQLCFAFTNRAVLTSQEAAAVFVLGMRPFLPLLIPPALCALITL